MSNTALKSHFAKMCEVSKSSINQGIKKGLIKTKVENGKEVVDLSHRITKEYLRVHTGSNKAPKVEKKTAKVKPKKPKAPPVDKGSHEGEEKEGNKFGRVTSLDDITSDNLIDVDKQDVDKFDKYEAALTKRQKREEDRNKLISRKYVEAVFAKLYSVDTNELKEMEDRLTPEICGIFKVDDGGEESIRTRKLINKEVTKALRHIKRIMNEFIKKTAEKNE